MKKAFILTVGAGIIVLTTIGVNTYYIQPRRALLNYLESMKNGDWGNAARYISRADQSNEMRTEWESSFNNKTLAHWILIKSKYQILKMHYGSNKVTMEVSSYGPDPAALAESAKFNLAISATNMDKYISMTDASMIKALENPNFPMSASEQTFSLIREEGTWKVVLQK